MSEQNALEKARELVKKDVADAFKDLVPPKKESEEEAKAKEAAEKEAKDKADKEAAAKLSDEEKAAKEAAEKEAEVEAEAEAKKKAEEEAAKKGDGDEEDPELAQLKAQNTALMGEVESLAGQVLVGPSPAVKPEAKPDVKPEDKPDKDKKPEPIEFVTEENFEDAMSSAKNVNALLARTAEVAAAEGERRGYERAIRETPALVDQLTEKTVSLREAVRDFLDANEDLVPMRQFVGVEVNRLKAENPEWTISKLFKEAGDSVRTKVKLSKVAGETDEKLGADGKPAFTGRGAGGGGDTRRQTTQDKLSPLQKEISELAGFAEGK